MQNLWRDDGRAAGPLYLGPSPSHISDILQEHACGWQVQHGDVDGMKRQIETILAAPTEELHEMGIRAKKGVMEGLSQQILQARLGERLEQIFRSANEHSGAATTKPESPIT